jgi:outer membrane lipoprotein carrier protein
MSPRKSLFVFAFTGVIFFRLASLLCLLQLASPYGYAESKVPDLDEIVRKVQEVYGRHCCFSAAFDQLTVNTAMDLKDRFQGTMYVRKPGAIALEVESPEKQKVVMRGRSYTVYFPQDGSAVRGEIPPEINVEHFFGFFANIGRIDKNFSVQFAAKAMDKDEMLFFLELSDKSNPAGTFRILLGVDSERYTIRRAIIYDALGNYNRFDLTDISFLSSIPDSRFQLAPASTDTISITPGESEP